MIDERDVLRGHAFVVKRIIPEQHFAVECRLGRIVLDGNEVGENFLADLACEGLALGDVFLAETFGAVAEDFVKENGGSAARKQRRTRVRLNERRFVESLGFLNQSMNRGRDRFVVRGVFGIEPIEIRISLDVHSVGALL